MTEKVKKRELVKCVVVGDTAVGKTRLICARACNTRLNLAQLLTTHVPTVWAIDQYRIYKDVLERSWDVVDGVNVSLRLWDTFGDHEKDRRFAYGRSDVVILCFAVNNPISLRNCRAMWLPEIRRFCPQTPVLLVGCKNDLRHLYRDETYLGFFRERSPFVRPTRKADLVMPDEGRSLARDLGVLYYETSVLTYHGVLEVFENAIRAALLGRRAQRFWQTNLKRVQRPFPQAPFCPPPPPPTEVYVTASCYSDCMDQLWHQRAYCDLHLVVGGTRFPVHRFVLAAASTTFHRLLAAEVSFGGDLVARSSSEASMVSGTMGEATVGDFNTDTELLLRQTEYRGVPPPPPPPPPPTNITGGGFRPSRVWEQLKRRSSCQILGSTSSAEMAAAAATAAAAAVAAASAGQRRVPRDLCHPAFENIRFETYDEHDLHSSNEIITVIVLSRLLTVQAVYQCLQFLYTGNIDARLCEPKSAALGLLLEVRQAAELLELPELLIFVSNIQAREEYLNSDLKQQYRKAVRIRFREICLRPGALFTDVTFALDDGTSVSAHRPMLMARCDMMKAMFSGDFRESSAKIIAFPGVRQDTFCKLLYFLYSDEISSVGPGRCVDLLALANRLCLPRLLTLVERRVVLELATLATSGDPSVDVAVESCLRLLESCKLHNADQLAAWCMNHLCTNYNKLCQMSPKLLRQLHPDNQEFLNENRWPPVWYVKDFDYYQKCVLEREREEGPSIKRGRHSTPSSAPRATPLADQGGGSGCLCFSAKSRRDSGA